MFESLQKNSQMSRMLLLTPRINEDIINEDDEEQVQILFDHPIH